MREDDAEKQEDSGKRVRERRQQPHARREIVVVFRREQISAAAAGSKKRREEREMDFWVDLNPGCLPFGVPADLATVPAIVFVDFNVIGPKVPDPDDRDN